MRQAILQNVAEQSGRPSSIVGQLFQQGLIGVECLGLQLVGFDDELYRALRFRHLMLSAGLPKKKSASPSMDYGVGHSKRRKANGAEDRKENGEI